VLVICSLSLVLSDILLFPACLTDLDCVEISTRAGADYRCLQYRCFPWDQQELQGNLRSCKTKEDCQQLGREEGGDGEDGECFKHEDRRKIHNGVCVRSAGQCSEPGDCGEDLVCINGYCGETEYLEELKTFPCHDFQYCKDLFNMEHCCFDLSSNFLDKKCCDAGGIIGYQDMPDEEFLNKIEVDFLTDQEKGELCMVLPQDLLMPILNCQEFISMNKTAVETMNSSLLSSSTTMSTISSTVSGEITTIDMQEDMKIEDIDIETMQVIYDMEAIHDHLEDIDIETMEVIYDNSGSTLDQTFYCIIIIFIFV